VTGAGGPAVRELGPDDWDAAAGLAAEAFGSFADRARWTASLPHSVCLGAEDGGRLVSFARVKPYAQWFGGRRVPMGGVASVAVAGTHQRRGLARATVAAALPVCRERGLAVSALFPATTPLYRSLGWEHAGDHTWLDVPAPALRALGPADGVRPATEADVSAMLAAYDALGRDTNGLLARDGPFFDTRPETVLGADTVLVAEDGGGVTGWARADRKGADHTVEVTAWDVVALTPGAARGLWFALGAGSSTVRTVRAKAFADDVVPLLGEPAVSVHSAERWMLRLVSLPDAVAARGWAGEGSVDLDVRDDQVPDNAGRWRLTVEAGHGTATRGGDGTVALGVGALSALYSGYADPRTLRRAGLLACADDAALDRLAVLTAGPRPRLLDYF
jgi:predicted acetyltransferase